MKKRSLALLLTGLMITGTLAGCGDNSNNESESDKTNTENTDEEKETEETSDTADAGDSKDADTEDTKTSDSELPQWAYGEFEAVPVDGVLDLSGFGMTIELPDELKDKQDRIAVDGQVTNDFGYASIYMTDPDDPDNNSLEIAYIVADVEQYTPEDYESEEFGLTKDMVADLGENCGFYYLAIKEDDWYDNDPTYIDQVYCAEVSDETQEEYLEFLSYSSEIIDNITFVDFLLPEGLSADDFDNEALLSFELTDLEGNEVVVGDYITGNTVTMINYWGTFCGPCINEMPELAELEKEYKDKGFEILGMTCDVYDGAGGYDEDILLDAIDIVEDTGVEYPVFVATPELLDYALLEAYPTTVFVDSEGNLLMSPIVGSHTKEEWEEYIAQAFEAAGQ